MTTVVVVIEEDVLRLILGMLRWKKSEKGDGVGGVVLGEDQLP